MQGRLDKLERIPKGRLAEGLGTTSVEAASLWLKKKMSRYGQDCVLATIKGRPDKGLGTGRALLLQDPSACRGLPVFLPHLQFWFKTPHIRTTQNKRLPSFVPRA